MTGMPEWLSHTITAVSSAGFVMAVAMFAIRWRIVTRLGRKDEIDVLQGMIDYQKSDIVALRAEFLKYRIERDRELAAIKNEHTACLLGQERLQGQVSRQQDQIVELKRLNFELEARIAGLEGA